MKTKLNKLLIIFFFILIIIKKDIIYYSIYNSTITWFKYIVPNIFPIYIIISLIIDSNLIINIIKLFNNIWNKIFKTSNYGLFIFIISIISGSPSNAKYINKLYENNLISLSDSNKILLYTNNYNPLLIYTILRLYLNNYESIIIIIIIILSNIIIGLINRNKYSEIYNIKYINNKININNIIIDTINTLLMILGVIVFYNLIISILPINNILIKSIINGLLEVTTGLKSIYYLNISHNIKILLSIIYLSFGGLSIHTQIKSIFPYTNYKIFIKNKILSIIISIILLLLFHNMKLL